jgi:hypothetical protein
VLPAALIIIVISFIIVLITGVAGCFLPETHYFPVITVLRSVDNGVTYHDSVQPVRIGTSVYLKYEISVKVKGFLSRFQRKKIEFELVIPCLHSMEVSIHEISCECNPCPCPIHGLVISKITRFAALADHKNPKKMKLILKCDRVNDESILYYFILKFFDKRLNTFYQQTSSLEYVKQLFV